jgi:hypothetical protein
LNVRFASVESNGGEESARHRLAFRPLRDAAVTARGSE